MDKAKICNAVYDLLLAIGEDPNREGLRNTPKRVANMYAEMLGAPEVKYTVFEEKYNDIVMLKDIEFCSLCEHHLLPFFGVVHIAYIPNKKTVGISKLARIVEKYAKRLQIQERMTNQIVEDIKANIGTENIAICVEAKHMCIGVRGIKKPTAITITTKFTGVFNNEDRKREFYCLLDRKGE
jgi:GTP cyclohydrolase I